MLIYHRDSLQQFNNVDLGACAGEWDPNEQNKVFGEFNGPFKR